uniref:Termicin n=1 Tax=Reticulitermes virginicus TaxID=57123 RepID=D9D784_RETVI|nr:termicin [Reticulitermes virginicus]ADJ18992.1 termicin [Reticulitermes virginicus]ADJ18993.1 termicin [Reticulitermes virginicus]ADJ18994.1 termicin [Reticulitermes virginicus]ADJ18997.1 termicin [Reticulitermes virginicus]
MRTLCILLVFLVAVCVFIAQHPAHACDFQSCWATCQAQHSIYFRRAFCDGSTCKCVFVTGG